MKAQDENLGSECNRSVVGNMFSDLVQKNTVDFQRGSFIQEDRGLP
jgi:hypothetical protein